MNNAKFLIFFLLISCGGYSQNILDRISFKTGYSYSTQVWGYSPFDHFRPPEKSIQSVFFNLQYEQPIYKKSYISIGLQTVQKGYKTYFASPSGFFEYSQEYQYEFSYLELPINYIYRNGQYSIILGAIVSYMIEDAYRFQETDITNYSSGQVVYFSNYSTPYPYPDRFKKWDFGINIGVSKQLFKNFDLELTMQKHFVEFDKWKSMDLVYNQCFLFGIKYRFLSNK